RSRAPAAHRVSRAPRRARRRLPGDKTMKTPELIEAATSSHRERDSRGVIQEHPNWSDLDPADRRRVFEATVAARRLEAALHPSGLSTTAEAVLRRLSR
ncbi:MAG: hypothetical protein AAGG01_23425, partial [Planctomycetota bacterium]